MPILALPTPVGTTPVIDIPGTPVVVAPVPIAGVTTHTLIAADGQTWDLNDRDHALLTLGRRGYDSPQYQSYTSESPAFDGEVFLGARATGRDIIVPLYLRADTREEFVIRKRNLLAALSPKRGAATLEVGEEDGTRRRISVVYTGRGGEGDWSRDQQGRNWVRYTLELRAPQPYWRGDPQSFEFRAAATGGFFPILPLRVSSGTSLGISDIVVPGDVESYPVWTVIGPTSGGIVLRTTDASGVTRSILLSSTLQAGQWVQIDTRPDQLTVLDQDGANLWGDVLSGSGMWPVPPGPITVEVTAGGSTSSTRIVLSVEPLYETA